MNLYTVQQPEMLLLDTNYIIQGQDKLHNTEKRFKCVHCDKSFKQKVHLMKHIRTHTGEKPFLCSICNTAFRQKEHLKNHQWVHMKKEIFPSSVSTNNSYNCIHCGVNFKSSYFLQRHILKVHNKYL